MPEISEWWQYIAYGAAKKVFEDRMDLESVQLIEPEFREQETLVLRRTIVQQSNKRAISSDFGIFNDNNPWGYGNGTF